MRWTHRRVPGVAGRRCSVLAQIVFWYRREFDMEHEAGEHGRKLRALLVGSNVHVPAVKSLGPI